MFNSLTRKRFARTTRSFLSHLYIESVVKRTLNRTVETRVLGYRLSVPPSVFHPGLYFTSKILGAYIRKMDLSGKHVLDAGCGSGILSLAAASSGASVTAFDINPAAVAATHLNAHRNGFGERIRATEVDISDGLSDGIRPVDLIMVNPPYYLEVPRSLAERAFKGGASNEFIAKLAEVSVDVLAPGGSIVMILSSDVDQARVLRPFSPGVFRQTILLNANRLFERLTIFRFERIGITVDTMSNSSM